MWDLQQYGNQIAFVEDGGKSMTYEELEEEVKRIGEVVPLRSLVFSFCTNRMDSAAGYVAFLQNRIVPLLLKQDIAPDLREDLINRYEPQYVYVPKEMKEEFPDFTPIYENEEYILLKTGFTAQSDALYPELALLLTTSGSTGSPKLVRQSYRNIEANTASIVQYLGLTSDERAITTLPMNYTYGLSIINSHLKAGGEICFTEYSVMREEFWQFFEKVQATSFGGVPYTYEILNRIGFTKRKLDSLRYMTQAGGKLSPELHQIFAEYAKENGKKFIVMYGQTEATARMGYLPGDMALSKCGSTGIAIPGGKLWLRDVDGSIIEEPNTTGELIYEGENVTLGYAQEKEDLKKGDERHGVLETGDMAIRDEDGYYYIVGRKKRFLKLYGNRVNLDETERLIRKKFPDVDLACGGKDDRLVIYIAWDEGAKSKEDQASLKKEVRFFLSNELHLPIQGFHVIFVPSILRSESGKIQYREMEAEYHT